VNATEGNTSTSAPLPPLDALPAIVTALPEPDIRARMTGLAKRGKLPGHADSAAGATFTADLFGEPLDYTLTARTSREGDSSTIRFTATMKPRTPAIFWALTLLTIWPGQWMTDSMIRTYFTSYDFNTWLWYAPLFILPMPFLWLRMLKKSKLAAADHAAELLERIATETNGRPHTTPASPQRGAGM